MQITTNQDSPQTAKHDMVVLGVYAGELTTADFRALDGALDGALKQACKEQEFAGKAKQQLVLHTLGKLPCKRVALIGLGNEAEQKAQVWLRFAGAACRLGNATGAKSLLLAPPASKDAEGLTALLARGAALGAYRYDRYKSDTGRTPTLQKIALRVTDGAAKEDLKVAEIVAESVALARDLVNQVPLELYPETFAAHAVKLGKAAGLTCKVLGPAELKKRNMNLLLGVGRGSERPPRLVHLSYTPAGSKKNAGAPVALVGKGITFDSGGLSLKTSDGMVTMKMDMAGAAVVLATLLAAAKLKLPVAVHGILALAENMPSGTAIRPGDVITSAAGKSIEINNTDAEGRLVLADALHYTGELEPRCIVDLATLTGACVVALGPHTTGLLCNRDGMARSLLDASARAGEDTWRLPLTASLRDQLKSDVADMRNTGDRMGGAIVAALFLKEFVGDTPWAHMDIAGPAWSAEDAGILTKGGTGVGVATLIDFLRTEVGPNRDFT